MSIPISITISHIQNPKKFIKVARRQKILIKVEFIKVIFSQKNLIKVEFIKVVKNHYDKEVIHSKT